MSTNGQRVTQATDLGKQATDITVPAGNRDNGKLSVDHGNGVFEVRDVYQAVFTLLKITLLGEFFFYIFLKKIIDV
jgi:hypothetical protein